MMARDGLRAVARQVERAYIQHLPRPDEEGALCEAGFAALGIPTERFYAKRIHRRRLPLTPRTLVAGELPVVRSALTQLGAEAEGLDDYPPPLRWMLRRAVWAATMREARMLGRPVFVKPRGKAKRFTGALLIDPSMELVRVGGSAPVWIAEPVRFRTEWRCYVAAGRVLGMGHYAGDPALQPDPAVVARAAGSLAAVAGLGMDVGVLDSGETALVECNDGFSLGAYDIAGEVYAEVLLRRWVQLVGQSGLDRI